jgi:hypothetical protein
MLDNADTAATSPVLRSIHGITANSSAVLLAATGKGSAHLEAQPVLQGPAWSTAAVLASRTATIATIASDADADSLPRDWQQLAKLANLMSFMALPIATGGPLLLLLLLLL